MALENLELYAGIALTILALAALIMLFPPGGLVLQGVESSPAPISASRTGRRPWHVRGAPDDTGAHEADGVAKAVSLRARRDQPAGLTTRTGKGPWQAPDDIKGPAAGKQLRFPNSRHTVSGSKSGEVKESNSVILRGREREIA